MQVVAYLLGILAIAATFREGQLYSRIICGILAFFWIWIGIFYHIIHFSVINPASRIFGIIFVLQGLLFLLVGTVFNRLAFRFTLKPAPIVGACLILYAMVIYSFLGLTFGHWYPETPMFGVAPCPATIFTFGLLLWATKPVPGYLIIIPLLWALIGMSAAVKLRVPQDYGLVVAGVVGTVLVLIESRKAKRLTRKAAPADARKGA